MTAAADYQARRVVTGTTADGRSTVLVDADSTTRLVVPVCTVVDLWSVPSLPANPSVTDPLDSAVALDPPPAGALVRMVTLPPDAEWKGGESKAVSDSLSGLGARQESDVADEHGDGMHITDTVDVIVVITGQIHAVLQETETVLNPGDSLVQRGTKHAWSNRSDQPATMVATMFAARR